jgi:hypothetical protein
MQKTKSRYSPETQLDNASQTVLDAGKVIIGVGVLGAVAGMI